MASIIERTGNGETEKRLSLNAEQIGRSISIGSQWQKIRIGVRWSCTLTTNYVSSPALYLGMCSGTTNMIGDTTPQHFVGWHMKPDSTVSASNTNYISIPGGTSNSMLVNVGGVKTVAGFNVNPLNVGRVSRGGAAIMVLEITKGSPNFLLSNWSSSGYLSTPSDFLTVMQAVAVPTSIMSARISGEAMAVDEATNGYLDTINFAWQGVQGDFELSDIAYTRLA